MPNWLMAARAKPRSGACWPTRASSTCRRTTPRGAGTPGTSPAPDLHFPADRRLVAFGIRVEAGRVGSFLRRTGILVASFVIGAPEHWQDDRNDPVADHQSADDHDDLGPGH